MRILYILGQLFFTQHTYSIYYHSRSLSLVIKPHSHESRGFSLVAMKTTGEAEAAITVLNSTDIMGQIITVEKVSGSSVANLLHV